MCNQKTSIRVLLRFFWKKKGLSAKAATEQICEVEGETASNSSILEIQALKTNRAVDGPLS